MSIIPFGLFHSSSRRNDWFPDVAEFDKSLNSYFNSFPSSFQSASNSPPLDLTEHAKSYTVTVSLPGVAPDDLLVDFDTVNNELLIKGSTETNVSKDKSKGEFTRRITERYSGTFERHVQFPATAKIDDDNIVASLEHGVLTLEIPKVAKDNSQTSRKRIALSQKRFEPQSAQKGFEPK